MRSKFWIENKGEVVLGSGKAALLHAIERDGSIQRAAEEFGMSYRHAWGIIKKMFSPSMREQPIHRFIFQNREAMKQDT
jgi:molybdate transport system regulatory protein